MISTFANTVPVSKKAGKAIGAFPPVCIVPTPGGPVPMPYPNQTSGTSASKTASKTAGKAMPTATKVSAMPSSAKTAADTSFKAVHEKGVNAQQLRAQLLALHSQILGLPGGNPDRWHELVDNYVIATAQLYVALTQ